MVRSFVLFLVLWIKFETFADTSIALRLNTGTAYGKVVSSSGDELLSGGLSIGYFTGSSPSASFLQSLTANTAWNTLKDIGYVDLRSITGGFLFSDFDWSFETNPPTSPYSSTSAIKGGVGLVPNIPNETQIYMIAFNSGAWNFGNNLMSSATFGGTEWGVISRLSDPDPNKKWLSMDGASKTLLAVSLVEGDVLVGTLSPNYSTDVSVRLSAVPEPSTAVLAATALALLFLPKPYLKLP